MDELIPVADQQPSITQGLDTVPETPGGTVPQDGLDPQPVPQPSEYRLSTGEVYKSLDSLVQGAEAKEQFIRQLKAENEFFRQNWQARQTPQPPEPKADAPPLDEGEVARLVRELEEVGYEGEAAVKMARFQVQRDRAMFQQATQQAQFAMQQQLAAAQAQQNMARYEQIKASDPRFDHATNPIAMGVIAANPGLTPDQHYALMQQAYQQLGIPTQAQPVQQPQQAWQQQRQVQFANPSQAGAAPQAAGNLPPVLQSALDSWKRAYPEKAADPATVRARTQELLNEYGARTGGAF